MSPRRIATLILLPLVVGAGGFAYYVGRGALMLLLREQDLPYSSISSFTAPAALVGLLVAAAVGAGLGGSALVPLGLFATAAGFAAQQGGAVLAGMALAALGRALSSTGTMVIVGQLFGPRHHSFRAAVLAACYGAVNLASLFSSAASGQISASFGGGASVATAAAMTGAIAVLALAFPAIQLTTAPDADATNDTLRPLHLGVAAVTLALGLAGWTFLLAGDNLGFSLQQGAAESAALLQALNPLAVVGMSLVVAVGLGAAGAFGVQVPGHALAGAGFLLGGLGLVATGTGLAIPAQVIGGLAEPLVWAGVGSAVVAGVHWRGMAVAAAAVGSASWVATLLSPLVPDTFARGAVFGLAAGAVVIGLLFVAAAWPVSRLLMGEAEGDGELGETEV